MILIKWGGSLLTNKSSTGPAKVDRVRLRRLCRELAAARVEGKAVLVHGAGSFGHPQAQRHGIGTRRLRGARLLAAWRDVRNSLDQLREEVVDALVGADLKPLSLPAAFLAHDDGRLTHVAETLFQDALRKRLLPLSGGDLTLHPRLGLRVLSGDELLFHLAQRLRPKRVVYATDVDGLILHGRLITELPAKAAPLAIRQVSRGGDATGGMRGKLEWGHEIQRLGVDVLIGNGGTKGWLTRAVKGRAVGTLLPGRFGHA